MSFDWNQALWNSPLYRETALIVLVSLFSIGTVIFFLRKSSPTMLAAWLSVQAWIFAAPLFLAVLGLPSPWAHTVLAIIAILGAKTFFQITGMYHRSLFVWSCYAAIVASALLTFRGDVATLNLTPMALLAAICVIPILQDSAKQMIQYICLCLFCFVLLGWSFMHLGLILHLPSGAYQVIYVVLLTEVCDNIYLAASRLGKIKLFHNIHTKRNLEGFVTAFFATLILAWALRHMLPSPDAIHWIVAGLVAALGGSLGDLVLAVVRRDLGIKDTGAFILGRSDVLDRMDRLIFVAPLYFYTQRFIEGLG